FKGHRFSIIVSLAQGLTVFGGSSYGKRVEEGIMGIGRSTGGAPGSPSDDYELRIDLGIGLRF
ncbi:MAG: hypothetical protein KDB07_08295, partial [Planctomycetes bacterium]|nr:hypothetical protein [Planctomycetota bacterium]